MYGTYSLGASFGAEVLGFQLSGTPSEADISAIRELWAEHKLLLFRNQSFDEATLVGFSRRFGDLEIHVREEYLSPEHPEILYVSNIERDGRRIGILSDSEVGWHYDQIYLPKPAVGSLLMADTLPPEGGNTEFADMCAAWEALPEATRVKLDGCLANQSYEAFNQACVGYIELPHTLTAVGEKAMYEFGKSCSRTRQIRSRNADGSSAKEKTSDNQPSFK